MKSFAKYCSCLLVALTTLTLVSFVQGTDFSSTPHRHNETAGGRCDDPIDDVCGDLFVTDLIAGQQYDAGDIFVWQTSEDSPLYIRYQTTGDWLISETHLAVEMALEDIPGWDGNPPPGQFEFGDTHNPPVAEVTYEVDISGFDVSCAAELFIAAHAVVETPNGECDDDDGDDDDGWPACPDSDYEYVDCVGNCFNDCECNWSWGYPCTEGLGDGYCDDGSYGLDFFCEEWGWDDGDCGGDPNGNSPPSDNPELITESMSDDSDIMTFTDDSEYSWLLPKYATRCDDDHDHGDDCVSTGDLEFYIPFSQGESGTYPAEGQNSDSVTISPGNPSDGYLNIDLEFDDVPIGFNNAVLSISFYDLDIDPDEYWSNGTCGTLVETFTLKDEDGNTLATLDGSHNQDGNFTWDFDLPDYIFDDETLVLQTTLTSYLEIAQGSGSINISNSSEGMFDISICGEAGCLQEESAWGDGEDFSGADWATYIVYQRDCCAYDFGDAIDGFGAYYQTLLANDGAHHQIVDGVYLGLGVDAETDGQPTGLADGDDNGGNDDEDGVIFLTPLNSHPTYTTEACVDVTASMDGFLNVWIDYNYIASWMDPSYHIFDDEPVTLGSNLLCWQIPAGLYDGDTFMRFRFTSDDPDGNLSYSGFWPNGEVEDYQVGIGTTLDNDDFTTPDEFIVSAPYPNPFNPALTVEYVVPNREFMTIRIFNVRGQEVASLYDGMIESGRHAITWNADSQPGGAYLLRIQYGTHSETHKVLLTK